MTDVELLVSLQANRAIFVDYVIVQTLMAAVIVYVAYMFRNFSQLIRAAAMIGAIISILSVTFFVTGVQMVKKHTKPNPEMGVTGGVVEQEAAIALSNLAIWNPSKKSKDKISYSTNKDGKKIRLFKSDSKEIK